MAKGSSPPRVVTGPDPMNPRDYLRVAAKRWPLMAAIFLITSAAFTAWAFRADRIYLATARLHVYQRAPRILSIEEVLPIDPSRAAYHQTQVAIIRSRKVAGAVFNALRIGAEPEFAGLREPVEAFRTGTDVTTKKDTDIIEIAYRGKDPEKITLWVNAIVAEYLKYNDSLKEATIADGQEKVRVQIPERRKQLAEAEGRLLEFNRKHTTLNLETAHGNLLERIRNLDLKLADIQKDLVTLGASWRLIDQTRNDGGDLYALPALRENGTVQALRVKVRDASEALAEAKLKYLDRQGNVLLESYKSRLREVEASLGREVETALAAVHQEYLQKQEEETRLLELMEKDRREAQGLEALTTEYKELTAEVERSRRIYDELALRSKEMESSAGMGLSNVTVLDGAMVPEIPIWPRKGLLVFLGVVLGAAGGMGVAFLLEYMDDSVRSQEDLEATLGLPLLGYVPRMEGRRSDMARRDLVSHREPKSTISEFFRTIRTGILYSSNGSLKSLMVTSAGPKEGKTTNAINLAITLAAGGNRVLLVDGDLRRARIHQAFGVPNEKGLSDLLTGSGPLGDLVQETDVENLHLLTSGPLPPNPAEMLGTPAMRDFLREACEVYDRVILDTPPVVAVTDACILASSVDGVIQVVASSKTSRKVLERGKTQLQSVGARLLGVILNDVRVKRSGYDSYYYAGYYKYSS